jgi:hypothetical protein
MEARRQSEHLPALCPASVQELKPLQCATARPQRTPELLFQILQNWIGFSEKFRLLPVLISIAT